ncbi:hypothetical protein JW868_03595, partial [Candidatus Woesearchaeota archaeon]|nr:hypothetical protein [Candidatus Woesearchaeota archaeon]
MKIILVLILALLVSSCKLYLEHAGELVQDEGTIEVYFCPRSNCSEILEHEIRGSADVKCAFYDLDLENIKQALMDA